MIFPRTDALVADAGRLLRLEKFIPAAGLQQVPRDCGCLDSRRCTLFRRFSVEPSRADRDGPVGAAFVALTDDCMPSPAVAPVRQRPHEPTRSPDLYGREARYFIAVPSIKTFCTWPSLPYSKRNVSPATVLHMDERWRRESSKARASQGFPCRDTRSHPRRSAPRFFCG